LCWLFTHVAIADKDILQACFAGQLSYIKGIFKEDGGFGISVGDRLAAQSTSLGDHALWTYEFSRNLAGFSGQLRDICVLAMQAAEVAAYGGYGISEAAGQKMIEWLLLNGIGVGRDQTSVYQGHELSVLIFPDAAYSSLARPDAALLVAEAALNIAFQLIPEQGIFNCLWSHEIHQKDY
jgi:hypothetical protein